MGRPRHPAAGRSGAGHRSWPLHRRSCRRALRALRAQPGRLRPYRRALRRRSGATIVTAADLQRRAADPPDAAQIQLPADRAATLGEGRRAFCRRAGRRGCCADQRRSRGHRRSGRDRDRRIAAGRPTRATRSTPDAPRVHATAPGNVVVEGRFKTAGLRRDVCQGAPQHVALERALAPPERDAARSARRACGFRSGIRPHRR